MFQRYFISTYEYYEQIWSYADFVPKKLENPPINEVYRALDALAHF